MNLRIAGAILLVLLSALSAGAAPVSRREVLAAIAVLEKDITSAEALPAAETVTRSGRESDDVLLIVGPETLPWVQTDVPAGEARARMLLMAVYFAGDIKSQLRKGRPADDPYAGWVAVIRAYRQFRQKQPDLLIPEVEALIRKDRAGTLRQAADDVRKQQEREEQQRRARNMI
jgi:hypothetical protein